MPILTNKLQFHQIKINLIFKNLINIQFLKKKFKLLQKMILQVTSMMIQKFFIEVHLFRLIICNLIKKLNRIKNYYKTLIIWIKIQLYKFNKIIMLQWIKLKYNKGAIPLQTSGLYTSCDVTPMRARVWAKGPKEVQQMPTVSCCWLWHCLGSLELGHPTRARGHTLSMGPAR